MPKQSTKTDVQIALLREISTKLDKIIVSLEKTPKMSEKGPKNNIISTQNTRVIEGEPLPIKAKGNRPQHVDYLLYTDGACTKNPGGAGGWAYIVIPNKKNGEEIVSSGGVKSTTNNKMEVVAITEGLKEIPKGKSVEIISDSEYALKTMKGEYRTKKNLEYWEALVKAMEGKDIYTRWVRGHAGDPFNERCDKLAEKAAKNARK